MFIACENNSHLLDYILILSTYTLLNIMKLSLTPLTQFFDLYIFY